jgi:hypothetical protein
VSPPRRFTVDERADRFQRRYTGPWRTVGHEAGPLEVSYRYRRRRMIEFARLDVAGHDLWTHAVWRGVVVPLIRRVVRRPPR